MGPSLQYSEDKHMDWFGLWTLGAYVAWGLLFTAGVILIWRRVL